MSSPDLCKMVPHILHAQLNELKFSPTCHTCQRSIFCSVIFPSMFIIYMMISHEENGCMFRCKRVLVSGSSSKIPNVHYNMTVEVLGFRWNRVVRLIPSPQRSQPMLGEMGHVPRTRNHASLVSKKPKPGKYEVRCSRHGSEAEPMKPASFQALTHQRLESAFNSQYVLRKRAKKSGAKIKSSSTKMACSNRSCMKTRSNTE